ncbi:uroporphyrinogen decarboxylase family protein [Termitidicoccus mucosus]|uniref:Uroporphyrinogen decarboxylase (URO-D) domain-containing protein n=1 Tax=Termitidicoccus mucosus TaxID=1184151 RepID=A0A178ID03_9BACT|nr:hypothetical protein AW736_25535 [Opitutaceae bacterium TSB47]
MILETKPDFEKCMERVNAWYANELLDRPPVRFSAHNEQYNVVDDSSRWPSPKDKWFDAEYQVGKFERDIAGREFVAETFPLFWPNLGPNAYPCMLGCEVEFGDVTTWARPTARSCRELGRIRFSTDNEYFKKLECMTLLALSRCTGKYLVGYTDIHTGVDCADAFLGTERLLVEMYDDPEGVKTFIARCASHFAFVFGHFNKILRDHGQPSTTWIGIPSQESFHIPSADLSSMLSREFFREFALPSILEEVRLAGRNILHMDGRGVAGHLDDFLAIKEIDGIQWVQGVGGDKPIMQWCGLIEKIQHAGKGVVVDLEPSELDAFMERIHPRGIYLCLATNGMEEQKYIVSKLERWR